MTQVLSAVASRAVTYGTISVSGLDIAYREAGDPAAPKVVLLHGFPASSHQYRDLIRALGGSFHVIRPGLSEFEVREIKLRDFKVPTGAIPRLVKQISRGNRPEGVAPNALAVTTPRSLADVRIANGHVTLYKTTGVPTP